MHGFVNCEMLFYLFQIIRGLGGSDKVEEQAIAEYTT